MNHWIDTLLILVLLINIYVLGTSRLFAFVKAVALQSVILAVLPLLSQQYDAVHSWILFGLVLAIKGVLIPAFIVQTIKKIKIKREIEPFISFSSSLFMGMLIVIVAFWLGDRIKLPLQLASFLVLPVSLATILIGLLILITRKKAVTQVVGYLLLENGIYILRLTLLGKIPLLIEVGILLDVFVAVFIMGIVLYHIDREFDHINIDELARLKG